MTEEEAIEAARNVAIQLMGTIKSELNWWRVCFEKCPDVPTKGYNLKKSTYLLIDVMAISCVCTNPWHLQLGVACHLLLEAQG